MRIPNKARGRPGKKSEKPALTPAPKEPTRTTRNSKSKASNPVIRKSSTGKGIKKSKTTHSNSEDVWSIWNEVCRGQAYRKTLTNLF